MTPINSYKHFDLISLTDIRYCEKYLIGWQTSKIENSNTFNYQPLLLKKIKNQYQLIAGHYLFKALIKLNVEKYQAYILETDRSEELFSEIIIYKNCFLPFNLIDKADLIHKLIESKLSPDFIKKCLSQIEEHYSNKVIEEYLALFHLDQSVKGWIQSKSINKKSAVEWCKFSLSEQKNTINLFEKLNIGVNKAKQILEILFFLKKRDQITLDEILSDDIITKILSDKTEKDTNILQNRLLDRLISLKNPEYDSTLKDLNNKIKSLHLAPKWKLLPPKYLEGKGIYLEAYIKDSKDFQSFADKINEINNEKITDIFSIIN